MKGDMSWSEGWVVRRLSACEKYTKRNETVGNAVARVKQSSPSAGLPLMCDLDLADNFSGKVSLAMLCCATWLACLLLYKLELIPLLLQRAYLEELALPTSL